MNNEKTMEGKRTPQTRILRSEWERCARYDTI